MTGSRRRPLAFLAVGVALAVVLALVLAGGLRHPAGGVATGDIGPVDPPGPAAADTSLLDLDLAAPGTKVAAPAFTLTDQDGVSTSLASFRGKVVVWSLDDDQCTDLCTLLAQDIVLADRDLGPAAAHVEWLAVNANPYYPSTADVRAWSDDNSLDRLPNWRFVTGSPAQLRAVWAAYHAEVQLDPVARTVEHSTGMDYIDPSGDTEALGNFSQGAVSSAFYAHDMAQVVDDLLPAAERVRVGGPDVEAAATRAVAIGAQAPSWHLPAIDGGPTESLASVDTGPLVLSFWSSGCGACVREMPAYQAIDDDFDGAVRFIGIDVADPRSAAGAFARRLGVHYPLFADASGSVAAAYDVDALPATFVISPSGAILATHEGALTHDQLEAVLEMDFPSLPVPST